MFKHHLLLNLLSLGLLLIGSQSTIAQSVSNSSTRLDEVITQVSFKPPADDQKPDRTAGAGSRQDWRCPQDSTLETIADTPLTALVPANNYGLTLAERPTFMVYLPKTSAKQVVLSIRENGTQHHSQTTFPITATPGIVSLQSATPLAVGKNYQWAMVLVCGQRPGPNDPAVAAFVRRVAPPASMNGEVKPKTALAQAVWSGEHGIWYDTLASLAEARQREPNKKALEFIWVDFLDSAGLNAIAP